MALYDGCHKPTPELKEKIKDLAFSGIPVYLIAKIVKLDDETVTKYYEHELSCAQPEAIARIAKTVSAQAAAGNEKSQALLLKTLGAKYGFVEKQVIESTNSEESQALKDKIKELEDKYQRDY